MLYFAYASNMDAATLGRYCPSAQALGPALLPGYRLAFNHFSQARQCGVTDIEPQEGGAVWGVIFDVPDAEVAAMDAMETPAGALPSYVPLRVTVLLDGDPAQPREVVTYHARVKQPGQQPSAEYLDVVLSGARANGLPAEYVAELEGLQASVALDKA